MPKNLVKIEGCRDWEMFTWTVVISSGLLPCRNCNGPSYPCNSRRPDNGLAPRLTLEADLRSEAWMSFPASRFCFCFCSIRSLCCSSFCCRKLAEGIVSNLQNTILGSGPSTCSSNINYCDEDNRTVTFVVKKATTTWPFLRAFKSFSWRFLFVVLSHEDILNDFPY